MLDTNLGLGTVVEILQRGDDVDEYGLLKAAIRAEVFLLADSLKTINAKLGVKVPQFPNGSGLKGSVVKVDHARALVRFLFSTEDEQAQEELVKSLAPPPKKKKEHATEDFDDDTKVLGMIAQLDPENAQAFSKMTALAKEKLAEMYRDEGAEELKKNVRNALEKEGMEIEFQAKGKVNLKRKSKSETGADGKPLEEMAA